MWAKEIEDAYQRWIHSPKLFGHLSDESRFYQFIWACVDDPGNAPDEGTFRERLTRDMRLESDEQGFPHPTVAKAQTLYVHLRAFAKSRE